MKIVKKVLSEYYEKIVSGEKKYDIRISDFDVNVGDIIVFNEIDKESKLPTGKSIEKTVTYIGRTKGWMEDKKEEIEEYGFVIMSLG